jgi:hypothetical protein
MSQKKIKKNFIKQKDNLFLQQHRNKVSRNKKFKFNLHNIHLKDVNNNQIHLKKDNNSPT